MEFRIFVSKPRLDDELLKLLRAIIQKRLPKAAQATCRRARLSVGLLGNCCKDIKNLSFSPFSAAFPAKKSPFRGPDPALKRGSVRACSNFVRVCLSFVQACSNFVRVCSNFVRVCPNSSAENFNEVRKQNHEADLSAEFSGRKLCAYEGICTFAYSKRPALQNSVKLSRAQSVVCKRFVHEETQKVPPPLPPLSPDLGGGRSSLHLRAAKPAESSWSRMSCGSTSMLCPAPLPGRHPFPLFEFRLPPSHFRKSRQCGPDHFTFRRFHLLCRPRPHLRFSLSLCPRQPFC